jgi:hypothetical protein
LRSSACGKKATLQVVCAPAPTYAQRVAPDSEKLVSEALKLPAQERAELVDRPLKSLDDKEGDVLEGDDRERLHAAIGRSEEQFLAGKAIPANAVLEAPRKKP